MIYFFWHMFRRYFPHLKGEYEDYTWGMGRTLYTILFSEFHFQLVPLIPFSAIAKKSSTEPLFLYFYACEKSQNQKPLKQRLKQKRRII